MYSPLGKHMISGLNSSKKTIGDVKKSIQSQLLICYNRQQIFSQLKSLSIRFFTWIVTINPCMLYLKINNTN